MSIPGILDRWAAGYAAGLLTVVAVLALSALPTVAYVNTFGPSPPATLP